MDDVTRRQAMRLAAATGVVGTGVVALGAGETEAQEAQKKENQAQSRGPVGITAVPQQFTNANVEFPFTSEHDTVALRPGGGQVSHFAEFTNPKGLMIAVSAGLQGKTVDFKTTGEAGGFWRSVVITRVH